MRLVTMMIMPTRNTIETTTPPEIPATRTTVLSALALPPLSTVLLAVLL